MKCKRVKTNSIPVVSWVSHSETCTLCLTNRASRGSPDFTSFCTKSTDLFQQHGFIGIEPENESVLMCFVKIKPGADKVFAKVKIHRDRTVSVTILGKSVNVTTATNPGTLSGLETLLMKINSTPICSGYAGFEDLMEKTTVFENGGDITYVESGYGAPSIIRHKDCRLFLEDNSSSSLCSVCSISKYNMFRWRRRNSEPSVLASKRPNVSLSNNDLRFKLSSTMKENKAIKRKLLSATKQLSDKIEKESITLDDALDRSFRDVVESQKDKAKTFAPGSPQQLLWDQQMEVMGRTPKGMRWHPTFLRWCISLYGKSPGAYKMLRGSKFLALPHQSTLQDYTSYLRVSPGINVSILKNLIDDVGPKKHISKNVTLVFDEIKIKSNLVYSKSTGKLKGFIETGDINDVINEFVSVKAKTQEKEELATHVIAFMVRGIVSAVKQVFAYYPCRGFTSYQLYWSVWGAVAALEEAGFQVRAFTSDGASPNRKFYRLHGDPTNDTPTYYTNNLYAPERRVYFVCDAPHLLKTARNNLENSNWNRKTRKLRVCFFVKKKKKNLLIFQFAF